MEKRILQGILGLAIILVFGTWQLAVPDAGEDSILVINFILGLLQLGGLGLCAHAYFKEK